MDAGPRYQGWSWRRLAQSAGLAAALALPAAAQDVTGQVTDADGDPIAGAFAYTVPFNDLTAVGEIAETDAHGRFSFAAPRDSSRLVIAYRGEVLESRYLPGAEDSCLAFALHDDLPDERVLLGKQVVAGGYVTLEAEQVSDRLSFYLYTRPEALRDHLHLRGNGMFTLSTPQPPGHVALSIGGQPYEPPSGSEEALQAVVDLVGSEILTWPASTAAPLAGTALGFVVDAAGWVHRPPQRSVDLGEPARPEGTAYVFPWRTLPILFEAKQPIRLEMDAQAQVASHALFDYRLRDLAPDQLGGIALSFRPQTAEEFLAAWLASDSFLPPLKSWNIDRLIPLPDGRVYGLATKQHQGHSPAQQTYELQPQDGGWKIRNLYAGQADAMISHRQAVSGPPAGGQTFSWGGRECRVYREFEASVDPDPDLERVVAADSTGPEGDLPFILVVEPSGAFDLAYPVVRGNFRSVQMQDFEGDGVQELYVECEAVDSDRVVFSTAVVRWDRGLDLTSASSATYLRFPGKKTYQPPAVHFSDLDGDGILELVKERDGKQWAFRWGEQYIFERDARLDRPRPP
ncbi:MAG: hypothetical protein HY369_04495 [Candidatus Aenigmarchaeota archaeon]|nr:hypothetical protein [Candidatus Aenigmarchaeota archaeon]